VVQHSISWLIQKDPPRTEDCGRDQKDEEKDRDRLWSNPKSKPNHIRLVNAIEAVGINPDETDDFGEAGNARDQSGDAGGCEKTTRTRAKIPKDVSDAVGVKFQRQRIQNQTGNQSRHAQAKPFSSPCR